MRRLRIASVDAALVALVAACSQPGQFRCALDEQCVQGGSPGRCEPATGFCSFPDDTCPSSRRYADNSGSGLAGACVQETPTTADAGPPSDGPGGDGLPGVPDAAPLPPDAAPLCEPSCYVVLQQGRDGYAGSEGTTVSVWSPDSNFLGDMLKVEARQYWASLLRFDLSPIPPGARVTSATLQLYSTAWSGTDAPVYEISVHRLLRQVVMAEATWNRPRSGQSWGLPGAQSTTEDHSPVVAGSQTYDTILQLGSFDLTDQVQRWVAGTDENHGLVIRCSGATVEGAWLDFADPDPADLHSPILSIEYE